MLLDAWVYKLPTERTQPFERARIVQSDQTASAF